MIAWLLVAGCLPGADTGDTGPTGPDPFADAVISFTPGDEAGFGQDRLPDVVLGAPRGAGDAAGSLDVVSLGRGGEIVVELGDVVLIDGPGPDLLVFENPFSGFVETGTVAVSDDGVTWAEWPCVGTAGCAGVNPVFANPAVNDLDPTDPDEAGGDAFDLADVGLATARYVRITDTGANQYEGGTGGFDLDAVAVVNGE